MKQDIIKQAPRSWFGNAALYLFIEQITVGSGAGQRQHQNIILNAVDEQVLSRVMRKFVCRLWLRMKSAGNRDVFQSRL